MNNRAERLQRRDRLMRRLSEIEEALAHPLDVLSRAKLEAERALLIEKTKGRP